MQSNEESNSIFGAMAAFSWNSEGKYICDPVLECSWLFKIEIQESKVNLHKWQCINKQYAAFGRSDIGPYFGYYAGAGALGLGTYYSRLPSNNSYYKKVNLLLELSQRSQVNCPTKVEGAIMNETKKFFKLNQLEVFTIKK